MKKTQNLCLLWVTSPFYPSVITSLTVGLHPSISSTRLDEHIGMETCAVVNTPVALGKTFCQTGHFAILVCLLETRSWTWSHLRRPTKGESCKKEKKKKTMATKFYQRECRLNKKQWTTSLISMYIFMHNYTKVDSLMQLKMNALLQLYILAHIHGACRWPAVITNSIIRNRWMLWGIFYYKYRTNEHRVKQVCCRNQEYHLSRNNLPDEVASSWLDDRKVRSLRVGVQTMNWATTACNTTSCGAHAKTKRCLCFSKLNQQFEWDERSSSDIR